MNHGNDHTTIWGTLFGTVLTLASTIDYQDYIKTIVLAIIGATVSFIFSVILRWLCDRVKR
jgi:uncharacterized membrane protein (UPF0136 family)